MRPFFSLPGAVAGNGDADHSADSSSPVHYGAPLIEQRALAEGVAVVDLSGNGIVTVSGPDRLSWLHSMTSQQLLGLQPGESTESMLLDANGRIERVMRVVDDGETCWLLVDAGSAAPLAAFLTRMRFALRVDVQDVSAEYATVLAMTGPASDALSGLEPTVVWHDPWAQVSRGGVQYAHTDEHPGAEWTAAQFVFPRERLAEIVGLIGETDSGIERAAGTQALAALEVRAWRPSRQDDVDERAIPHEFDWLRTAVHLTKGCYRGQETVAKVHNLGHPPRRLVLLHLDGSSGELPVSGALVYAAGAATDDTARPVGRVTRAVLHYEWGAMALALVKRSVAQDAMLEVRGGVTGDDPQSAAFQSDVLAAAQEVIVPSDAGRARDIPRLRRL